MLGVKGQAFAFLSLMCEPMISIKIFYFPPRNYFTIGDHQDLLIIHLADS